MAQDRGIQLDDFASDHEDLHKDNYKDGRKSLVQLAWCGPSRPTDDPPRFQSAKLRRLDGLPGKLWSTSPRKLRTVTLCLYLAIWFVWLRSLIRPYVTEVPRYGRTPVVSYSCGHEAEFWRGENDKCGTDAKKCLREGEMVIRCPALCDSGSLTYSALQVGDQSIRYKNYYVGGGASTEDDQLSLPYRSDSFPCGAAIHAGVISPLFGGCARIKFTGAQYQFVTVPSYYNTDDSIAFDSFFPGSFQFVKPKARCSNCKDPRVLVATTSIILGLVTMYICPSEIGYWVACVSGFWSVVLSFDPPVTINPLDPEAFPNLLSVACERFLPLCFVLVVIWNTVCSWTLGTPSSPLCKALLWFPAFWLGMLNNVTFDRLPIDRFTPKDLAAQPGGVIAALFIVSLIVVALAIQALQVWKAGKLRKYVYGYIGTIILLTVLARFNGLSLRIHHYILGLLLLPGTRTKGFTAYLFQGLLVGLVVNGICRWGMASIAETNTSLLRDDSAGRPDPPNFLGYSDQWLTWNNTGAPKYSLLINDIEVYRGPESSISINNLAKTDVKFGALLTHGDATLYLRVAQLADEDKDPNSKRSAYTKAAKLDYASGQFTPPEEGTT